MKDYWLHTKWIENHIHRQKMNSYLRQNHSKIYNSNYVHTQTHRYTVNLSIVCENAIKSNFLYQWFNKRHLSMSEWHRCCGLIVIVSVVKAIKSQIMKAKVVSEQDIVYQSKPSENHFFSFFFYSSFKNVLWWVVSVWLLVLFSVPAFTAGTRVQCV